MRLTSSGNVQLLIATARQDVMVRCNQDLPLQGATITAGGYDALQAALLHLIPQVMLLDLELPGLEVRRHVSELCSLHPQTRIIAVSDLFTEDDELDLFMCGVWCCCPSAVEPRQLKHMIDAVKRGEMWIRRSFISRLMDALRARRQLNSSADDLVAKRFDGLTSREQEIARLIGEGHSNKQIARQLRISDRTVKGHLTQIFRKLGVNDRLMLALHVARNADVKSIPDDCRAWVSVCPAASRRKLGAVEEGNARSDPLTGT